MDAITLVRVALDIISERLLVILVLGLSFGLACWVMYMPSWDRFATMALFSVFSYLCINIKERTQNERHQGPRAQE